MNPLRCVVGVRATSSVSVTPARADVGVGLTLTPAAQDVADQLGISLEDLAQRAEAGIAKGLNLVNVKSYLRSFGDATSFAGRGLGADDASNSELFTLGIGVHGEGITNDSAFSVGAAASVTILGGMNLAR